MDGRRGAHRSESSRRAILTATATQFSLRGWDQLTIEGIAAEAQVGKQTIYRWWRSKAALVAECLLEGRLLPTSFIPRDTGDIGADLTNWLQAILTFATEPRSAALFRSLVSAAAEDEQVAARLRDALGGPSALINRLDAARRTGDLPPDVPLQLVADALVGVIILRVIARSPSEPGLASQIVGTILTREARA